MFPNYINFKRKLLSLPSIFVENCNRKGEWRMNGSVFMLEHKKERHRRKRHLRLVFLMAHGLPDHQDHRQMCSFTRWPWRQKLWRVMTQRAWEEQRGCWQVHKGKRGTSKTWKEWPTYEEHRTVEEDLTAVIPCSPCHWSRSWTSCWMQERRLPDCWTVSSDTLIPVFPNVRQCKTCILF